MSKTPLQNPRTNATKQVPTQGLPAGYLAFWGIAAAASLAYLTFTVAQPQLLSGASLSAESKRPNSDRQTRAASRNDALSDEQMEIAKRRTRLSRQEEQRLAAAKTKTPTNPINAQTQAPAETNNQFEVPGLIINPPIATPQTTTNPAQPPVQTNTSEAAPPTPTQTATTSATNTPTTAPKAATRTLTPTEMAAAQRAAIKVPPIPVRAPPPPVNITRVIDTVQSTAKSVGTAAVEQVKQVVPVNFGEPQAPKPGALMGVRLGTGPSVEALRLTWSFLMEHHQPALRGLEPRYFLSPNQEDAFGPTYALVAGPVTDEAKARSVCLSLATRGMKCEISLFGGSAL